jgi:uncharacterized membrane protein
MTRLLNYFLRGLVVTAPLGITLYVCWVIFTKIDGWLGLPIPGLGFLATIALITLIGALASNLVTRGFIAVFDGLLERLPFVRLLYSATKDLLNAFVGEKRRFDKPVLVRLFPGGSARALGFVTQETLTLLGMAEHVSVYLPQSYNFAGQLLVFPASDVEPLAAPSSEVMAFIVSGGVTDIPRPHTGRTPPSVPAVAERRA